MAPKWLAAAIVVSAAVVVSAPFVGQLQVALRRQLGDQFVLLMAGVVGGAVAAAVALALLRIRDRRTERYAALAAALTIAVGYALASRTGDTEVDAVERFHFVEYGVIAALFYNVWRRSADASVVVMPLLAGAIVGISEEWLQWFIPARVGELRDVVLNLFAIACALLFCLGVEPPRQLTPTLAPSSRRRVGLLASATLVALGVFVHSAHLGHEIADSEAGVFRSRYTAEELARLSDARARDWRQRPPVTWSRLSREDQYLSEGVAHVRRRNTAWDAGDLLTARHENLILERYFAPVLDSPSYMSAIGHRWPASQRAEAEAVGGPGFMIYDSNALPYPVFTWPAWAMWLVIAGLIAGLLRLLRGRT